MHKQQGSSYVYVVLSRKVFAVDVLNRVVSGNASVVHDNVELELASLGMRKVVLGDLNQVLGSILRAHAGLDAQRFDAIFGLEFRRKIFGDLGGRVGCIIDDNIAALAGQITRNLDTDAFAGQ